jgi:serine/threonine protein kinase
MEGKHEDTPLPSWALIEFDDIHVGDMIGGGGVGIIYKGQFRGKQVALKALFDTRIGEDLKREFMDELLVMSKLQHSNIVTFLGACMTPPNLCFVMEICECSLHDLLHVDRSRFTSNDVLNMAVSGYPFPPMLHPTIDLTVPTSLYPAD